MYSLHLNQMVMFTITNFLKRPELTHHVLWISWLTFTARWVLAVRFRWRAATLWTLGLVTLVFPLWHRHLNTHTHTRTQRKTRLPWRRHIKAKEIKNSSNNMLQKQCQNKTKRLHTYTSTHQWNCVIVKHPHDTQQTC